MPVVRTLRAVPAWIRLSSAYATNHRPFPGLFDLSTTSSTSRIGAGTSPQRQLRSSSSTRRTTIAAPPRHSSSGGPGGLPLYIWVTAGGTCAAIASIYFAYLDEVPLTHRQRWIATSPEWERQLGDEEYNNLSRQFAEQNAILPASHRASRTVHRVGTRVAAAADKFAREHQLQHYLDQSPYTFTVVRTDIANAFVLPNNHVFVMTGLFRFIQNEDDIAAVLAHEMGHVLARHAGEKMSGSFVVNLLARLSLLVDPSGVLLTILLPAATLFRELPHSRTQETEADQIGVFLAAEACYDPRAAKRVFAAMKDGGGDEAVAPPEFLSTHPSHDTRIANFDQWLPEAMKLYQSDGSSDSFGVDDGFDDQTGERCRQVRKKMQVARQHAAQQAMIQQQQQQRALPSQ